MKAETEN